MKETPNQILRPVEELFLEKYFGIGPDDWHEKTPINIDMGHLVNVLTMFRAELIDNKDDLIEKAFVAGRSQTSWGQFKKDNSLHQESEMNPKIICYCGSLRVALDAFKKVEYQSALDGNIALLPCCMFVDIQREYGSDSDYKQKADELHKRKIDICDEVFVLNVGGYIGESTRSEIEYAEKIGKPIKYLECVT